MKIFIDTANLSQISEANALGILDGVTTNPTLMAKEGIHGKEEIRQHYLEIAKMVHGDVSAEVLSTDSESMVREGKELASIHPNIIIKIPCTNEGLKVLHTLRSKRIRTNCTLVFNAGQAMMAARAGADYVSPFVGRLDDIGDDGISLVASIVDIFRRYQIPTMVLAASIRSMSHFIQCMDVGADVATCPFNILKGVMKHPLTDSGLKAFMEDAARMTP